MTLTNIYDAIFNILNNDILIDHSGLTHIPFQLSYTLTKTMTSVGQMGFRDKVEMRGRSKESVDQGIEEEWRETQEDEKWQAHDREWETLLKSERDNIPKVEQPSLSQFLFLKPWGSFPNHKTN